MQESLTEPREAIPDQTAQLIPICTNTNNNSNNTKLSSAAVVAAGAAIQK